MRLKVNSCMHSTHSAIYWMTDVYIPTHTTHINTVDGQTLFFFFTQIQCHHHRFSYQNTCYTYIFATQWMFNSEMLQQMMFDEFETYKTRLCLRFVRRHNQFNHFSLSNIFQYELSKFSRKPHRHCIKFNNKLWLALKRNDYNKIKQLKFQLFLQNILQKHTDPCDFLVYIFISDCDCIECEWSWLHVRGEG